MENTIEFTKDLQKRVLGSGQNGTCYLTSDGQVFKRIYKPQIVEGNISSTVGLYNKTYVFPKKLVTFESAIIGYIMDYVDGIELRYLNNEISLRDYINALKEDTHLNLNVIVENSADVKLINTNTVNKDDIVFYCYIINIFFGYIF